MSRTLTGFLSEHGKYMKKPITITPVSEDISLQAIALNLKNDFLSKGFSTVSAFISICQFYVDEFKSSDSQKLLNNWWYGRVRDAEINDKVQIVINKLTTE